VECTFPPRTAFDLARRGSPVECVVQDERARRAVWLEPAYPGHRIGIEYDGEEHTTPAGVRRDIGRPTDLVDQGWRLYRYTSDDVDGAPDRIVGQVARALGIDVRALVPWPDSRYVDLGRPAARHRTPTAPGAPAPSPTPGRGGPR
jgi:hypothetical protein